MVICTSGSCDFILDDGRERKTVHLNSPSQGLYIKHNIWREFTNFSKDCVVMVLASEYYDKTDYIRDYDEILLSYRKHSTSNNKKYMNDISIKTIKYEFNTVLHQPIKREYLPSVKWFLFTQKPYIKSIDKGIIRIYDFLADMISF